MLRLNVYQVTILHVVVHLNGNLSKLFSHYKLICVEQNVHNI